MCISEVIDISPGNLDSSLNCVGRENVYILQMKMPLNSSESYRKKVFTL